MTDPHLGIEKSWLAIRSLAITPKEGPRCEECPRYASGVVVADRMPTNKWSGLVLVGESPGGEEVSKGVVFVGPTGKLLDISLKQVGADPSTVWMTNAVACGLRYGAKLTEKEERQCIECCYPVLTAKLDSLQPIVVTCLGASSWLAMTKLVGIEKYRGCVLEPEGIDDWFLVPTLHPAGLLRREEKRPAFDQFCADLAKSVALCTGEVKVEEPTPLDPTLPNVLTFLRKAWLARGPVSCDIETNSKDPETAKIVSLGFGWGGLALCVLMPEFGGPYTPRAWETIEREIRRLLGHHDMSWIFQNKGFDIPRLERRFGLTIHGERHDTMLQHHAIWPKTTHDLQNIATQLFAVRPWKCEFDVVHQDLASREILGSLQWYNAFDAWATEKAFHKMTVMARANNVEQVYERDRALSDIAIDWTRVGVLVDEEKRAKLEVHYAGELERLLGELREMAEDPEFNPLSTPQLSEQLLSRGILPAKRTPTGKISTNVKALFPHREEEFVSRLLKYRESQKLHSTYIKGLGKKVWSDGRLHPTWNITATPTGRFGTVPAIQNWPHIMREMLIPPPGFVWIGADYKALELRIIAQLAGLEDMQELFIQEQNVHRVLAETLYFSGIWGTLNEEERKKVRKLGKSVTFGDNYMAGANTLYETVRKEHPKVTLQEVTIMQAQLRNRYPRKVEFARIMMDKANRELELRTPWLGRRRRWPLGQVPDTEASNHPIQGGAGDIAGEAAIRWTALLKKKGDYHTRVFPNIQLHDAYYAYVQEDYAEEALHDLMASMYCEKDAVSPVTGKTYHMVYSVEGQIGHDLKNMEEVT